MTLGLTGTHVLITGGTRGIGLACARLYLEEGARVSIWAGSADSCEAALREWDAGDRVDAHVALTTEPLLRVANRPGSRAAPGRRCAHRRLRGTAQQDARAGAAGAVGLLLAHFAIRQLMMQAAWPRGLDPDRLSFTHAVRVIKPRCRKPRPFPPERLASWRDAMLQEIARGRCVSSRGRFNPRGVKRKMSNFKVRHRGELLTSSCCSQARAFGDGSKSIEAD